MRFIRAAESVNMTVMRQCTIEYPYITTHVNPANPEARSQPGMMDLRSHAVELARKSLLEEIQQLNQSRADMEAHHAKNIKERIHTKLRRLAPGDTSSLCAMRLPAPPGEPDTASSGEITTKPDRIAAELARHWAASGGGRTSGGWSACRNQVPRAARSIGASPKTLPQ